MSNPTTTNYGFPKSDPGSPDHHKARGGPAFLDTALDAIDTAIASAGGGPQTTKVTLTASQIKTLNSSPVQLLAAPGAGKVIVPLAVTLHYKLGTREFGPSYLSNASVGAIVAALGAHWVFELPAAANIFGDGSEVGTLQPLGTSGDDSTVVNAPLFLTGDRDFDGGPIATSDIGDGGSGYASGDTGSIDQDGNEDATYTVTSVDGGGAVTAFTISNAGSGYIPGSFNTDPGGSQAGSGSGFQVAVDTVGSAGDGTIDVFVTYLVITL